MSTNSESVVPVCVVLAIDSPNINSPCCRMGGASPHQCPDGQNTGINDKRDSLSDKPGQQVIVRFAITFGTAPGPANAYPFCGTYYHETRELINTCSFKPAGAVLTWSPLCLPSPGETRKPPQTNKQKTGLRVPWCLVPMPKIPRSFQLTLIVWPKKTPKRYAHL